MATLLELVKDLADMSGLEESANITTVEGVTQQEIKDLIRWVRTSNREIERMHDDWFFRIKEAEIELEQDVARYDITQFYDDFQKVLPYSHPLYAANVLVGEDLTQVKFVPYPRWAGRFEALLEKTLAGQPRYFTRRPSGEIEVFPKPSKAYRLKFNYLRKPQMMTVSDKCEPAMPDQHTDVILYHALRKYTFFDEAQLRMQTVQLELDQAMLDLVNDQRPEARFINPSHAFHV